ncbi:uncharacterized protein LOC135147269 [Daucus carota subsp. sativus]|uniref:uncharacterized protein LOC135147269 n=1 Tax=Daucus carota subsp. sativus TaxID=79200 RepID=UPI0030834A06
MIWKSLKDFPDLPFPTDNYRNADLNRLIIEETSYNVREMKEVHDANYQKLNSGQRCVYNSVIDSVLAKKGDYSLYTEVVDAARLFFGNSDSLPSFRTSNCNPCCFSGIAATLLPGGRTAHSRFHIPIKLDQYSCAGIKHGTDLAELIKLTDLIIGMRRLCNTAMLLSVLIILPVIPKASRAEIIAAALNKSKLWDHCQVFLLFQNMRLHAGNSPEHNQMIKEFSEWQLQIGDGKVDPIRIKNTFPRCYSNYLSNTLSTHMTHLFKI